MEARALKQSRVRARERERERERSSGSRLSGRCGDAGCPLLLGYPQPTGKLFAGTCERERAYIISSYTYIQVYAQTYARRINLQAVCQNKRRVKLKLARPQREYFSDVALDYLSSLERERENFRSFHRKFSLSDNLMEIFIPCKFCLKFQVYDTKNCACCHPVFFFFCNL
jgi:hypothetical protein